jgi:hypothetical protein
VTLDIPEVFDASQGCFERTYMERNCGAFISGPNCERRKVDGLFGHLEGTVGRLGRCDPRPPEPGHLAGAIYGLHLSGLVRAQYSPQRRVYGPPLTLDLDQVVLFPTYEPPFPGPAPVAGSMAINGKTGFIADALSPHWEMKTRVFSNCPPGGDPKAKVHLNFFLSGAFG